MYLHNIGWIIYVYMYNTKAYKHSSIFVLNLICLIYIFVMVVKVCIG